MTQMAKQTNRLTMNKLAELSLVDSPANPHAQVAVYKRASGAPPAPRGLFAKLFKSFMDSVAPPDLVEKEAQSYAATRAISELWERTNALSTSISSIFAENGDSETKKTLLDATISQFRDDIQALNVDDSAFTALEDGSVAKQEEATPPAPVPVAVPDAPPPPVADPHAGATGEDSDIHKGNPMKKTVQTFTDLAVANAAVAKMVAEHNELVDKVDALEAAADPVAAITKGMPPAAAQMFRDQQTTIQKLQADGAQAVLVTKATKIAKNTGADVSELANVLKLLGGDAKAEAFVTDVFAKYDSMLSEFDGLEIGTVGEEGSVDAQAALNAAVIDVQKNFPKLSRAEAVSKALELNPALYNESELSESVAV